MAPLTSRIQFPAPARRTRVQPGGEILLLNDCYNANPISMRAATDHLASRCLRAAASGDPRRHGGATDAPGFHAEIAAHARANGIGLLIGVGELAREHEPRRHLIRSAGATLAERILNSPATALVKDPVRSQWPEELNDALRARLGRSRRDRAAVAPDRRSQHRARRPRRDPDRGDGRAMLITIFPPEVHREDPRAPSSTADP